jgi:ADP-ribosyl-[dinitrogen reductase] hydrolase
MGLACPSRPFRIDLIGHGRATIGVSTLPQDLDAVAAFQPDAIVTLLSAHELRQLGRGDLLDTLPGLTPQWHHVPLRASGGSDVRFERLWSYTGHRLRAVLRRGGRVLLHCDEGGARARWAAARLLSELGAPPSEAAARSGAQPGPAASPSFRPRGPMADHHLAARILGGLFGGALGDAYGYPVEFRSRKAIKMAFGKAGLTEPRGRLVVSDDTQMTLFTADGLLTALAADGPRTADRILSRIRYAYLAWFRTQRDEWSMRASGFSQHRELWAVRSPGSTCLAALSEGARGTPEKPVNDSKGSGAVMRVAPLGLTPAIDADQAFHLAHAAAAFTHGHPNGRLSAAALASLLRDLLDETPMTAALALMESRLQAAPGGGETLAAVRKARALAAGDIPPAEALAALGEGWTGDEALAVGLYAALRADSFEAAVRLAADHDGDSDTTAAIAGQIWGVVHGLDAAPHGWIQRLDVLEPLCDIAHRLVATAAAMAETAPSSPAARAPQLLSA